MKFTVEWGDDGPRLTADAVRTVLSTALEQLDPQEAVSEHDLLRVSGRMAAAGWECTAAVGERHFSELIWARDDVEVRLPGEQGQTTAEVRGPGWNETFRDGGRFGWVHVNGSVGLELLTDVCCGSFDPQRALDNVGCSLGALVLAAYAGLLDSVSAADARRRPAREEVVLLSAVAAWTDAVGAAVEAAAADNLAYNAASVLEAAARNPVCPADALRTITRVGHVSVIVSAAAHPACPADALTQLSLSRDVSLNRAAAAHPSTPSKDLARLARSPHDTLRSAVAANLSCPDSVLDMLAADANAAVRAAVASNASAADHVRSAAALG